MSFTVENFRDLIRLLEEHPEWRAELRRLVLTEELLSLPERLDRLTRAVEGAQERLAKVEAALAELAARQAQTEATLTRLAERAERLEEGQAALVGRMDRVEAALAELAARQAQTEAALATLTQRVDELAARQAQTEAALRELAERQAVVETTLAGLIERSDRLEALHIGLRRDVDELKGWALETRYERRLPSILGRLLRRAEVATPISFLEAIEDRLSQEAFEELRNADLLVRARLRDDPQRTVWLVVEVSAAVDPNDVARATRRAALLRETGEFALPVVAGARVTAEAEALLDVQPVVFVQDGTVAGWERALTHWESPPASL